MRFTPSTVTTNKFFSKYIKNGKKEEIFMYFMCLLSRWQLCLISFTKQLLLLIKSSRLCSWGKSDPTVWGYSPKHNLTSNIPSDFSPVRMQMLVAFPFFTWGEQVQLPAVYLPYLILKGVIKKGGEEVGEKISLLCILFPQQFETWHALISPKQTQEHVHLLVVHFSKHIP